MAVPRNRSSHATKGSRRAHHSKNPLSLKHCPNCSNLVQPHRVCASCGFYKNRAVVQSEEA